MVRHQLWSGTSFLLHVESLYAIYVTACNGNKQHIEAY